MPLFPNSPAERAVFLGKVARLLVPVIYVAAAGAFVSDLMRSTTLAYGIIYIPLIGTGLLHRQLWTLWALAGTSILLVVIGAFFPFFDPDLPDLVSNRILSVLAILATSLLVYHARSIQVRLAAETQRAETAERIRTDILSNIGREMRTPLHTTIAMLGLMLTNCREDQRGPLGKLRAGTQQLLLTLDNLIGLTQIDDTTPHPVKADVAALLRQAVADVRTVAADSGVSLELSRHVAGSNEPFEAVVDPQMTRRILNNLLSNAIRVTPPSGTVCVAIRQEPDAVAVAIGDSSTGMPAQAAMASLCDPTAMADALMTPTVGVGLTFSLRTAEAMGATLTIDCVPEVGTTVLLLLPLTAPPVV